MVGIFTIIIGVIVFNLIWNTDASFSAKLCASEDGLIVRAKYPAHYRLENPQEKIDTLALQLARSGRVDRYVKLR
jgi:hypothetical protein